MRTVWISQRKSAGPRADEGVGELLEARPCSAGRRARFARFAEAEDSAAASAAPSVAAYLGCGRGAGARLDARAASPSGRKARTAFYGRGAAGHAQPYLAARRYAGVAQCGIGVELRIEFQRNLARGLPLGRSLFRGGAPCGTAVPCRSARLYVHRSRHEVRHLGLCRRSRRDGCAAGRGAAFRVGGQAASRRR